MKHDIMKTILVILYFMIIYTIVQLLINYLQGHFMKIINTLKEILKQLPRFLLMILSITAFSMILLCVIIKLIMWVLL